MSEASREPGGSRRAIADGGSPEEVSTPTTEFGTERQYRTARDLFSRLDRTDRLVAVRRRLARLTGGCIALVLVAFGFSPGGLSGTLLSLWGYVGLGLGLVSGLLWLSTNRYLDGTLERPDGEATVDAGTAGAPVLAWLVAGSRRSAGTRVLWSVLLGDGTLPAAEAVAEESSTVDEAEVGRLRGYVTRAAQLSVGLVAVDLFVRYAPVDAITLFVASGGATRPTVGGEGLPALDVLASLSGTEWVVVLVGVVVGGGLLGLLLAVTTKR